MKCGAEFIDVVSGGRYTTVWDLVFGSMLLSTVLCEQVQCSFHTDGISSSHSSF